MSDIAVGIVLIPELEVLRRVVSSNHELEDKGIRLEKDGPFPHITLTMIHMDSSRVEELKKDVENLAQRLILSATGVSKQSSSTSKSLLWMEIKLSEELGDLHQAAMALREKYHVPGTSAGAFSVQTASASSIQYVERFENHGLDDYNPHITIGYGKLEKQILPFSFFAEVRLGHLGEHCTVAELI